ncbi:hypothetical protein ROHU_006820 [Labeo rohita]|uniref:Uncharacterized protein n=1 Tax=Labeo rohita TaxID=84645 RepID=A0A498MPG4_LABRO|nr:hypothetical protein ROHU_006820 [Labeo rohita]
MLFLKRSRRNSKLSADEAEITGGFRRKENTITSYQRTTPYCPRDTSQHKHDTKTLAHDKPNLRVKHSETQV